MIALQPIGDDNLAVSRAFQLLVDAGLIHHGIEAQTCPLCAYEHANTLSGVRVTKIESWNPIAASERKARRTLEKAMNSLTEVVRKAVEEYDDYLPNPLSRSDWDLALKEAGDFQREVADGVMSALEEQTILLPHVSNGRTLIADGARSPANLEQCESFISDCVTILEGLTRIPTMARAYRDTFAALEAKVGAEASKDPIYRLKESLIECIGNVTSISEDLRWEQAKRLAQRDLQQIRQSLIDYRQQFLETRRTSFNDGIESVWMALRKERYSSFSQLHIPSPRGRGFPIEIELKASLDDSISLIEVDALRVFSESQVNALGIAAFITRAKLLGHQMLIFDDPVQSMDEEHFKTFARDLIPQILGEGFQVILLTHNDTFARDVSHYHCDRTDYVTMSIQHSRRQGCRVMEGNRRVPERLALAEDELDHGNFAGAWKYIRLAIERLYLITYVKYGPSNFKAENWQHQTAESMWNSGVGDIIESKFPGSESRLKDIIDMTAAGAHDTPPRGETDIRDSVAFLRTALGKLRVGG